MEYSKKQVKKHTVITLEGALDIYSAPSLKKDLHTMIDEGLDSIAIDMVHIKLLDSSGIALLANIQKRLKSEGGKFFLLHVNPDVHVILKLSSLDQYFTILDDETLLP